MSGWHMHGNDAVHRDDLTCGWPEGRPVVVIDPEDREQACQLSLAYNTAPGTSGTDKMQHALRALANPKPPEPKGLGAVVEDESGRLWMRWAVRKGTAAHPAADRPWAQSDGEGTDCRYDHINAVRVLSEGVTR